ncbi:MAG: hypothetical protein ACLQLC_17995 [Candidatus Sulfotelmatobacter sp.]
MTLRARLLWGTVLLLASTATLSARDKKEKPKSSPNVDSGVFGVYVRGQRVVNETFSVQQEDGVSIIKSHLQEVGTSGQGQKSEMRLTSSGELLRYEWTNGTGSLSVMPNNEFLLEKITTGPSAKPAEQPFLMPNTSVILDNNFFIHREVLTWRYLGADCHPDPSGMKCSQSDEYGVLIPQDRISIRVRMELVGREKVNIRGTERELLRLNLKGDEFSWALWVDDKDQYKLIRVSIPDANTEVIRD